MTSFFIDTSVFISTLKPDHATQECKRFMSRVKNGLFNGYISPYVAGEMMHSILYSDEIRREKKPEYMFDILDAIISSNAEWFIPHATFAKILCVPLVTIDGKLLRSRGLREQGVEILHPMDAVNRM